MSRTRIVKGNITKITGGNYKRYSKEDIENIGSKVIQIGKEDGVFYGKNEEAPLLEIDLTNTFKGRAIFKIINPLPTFVAQDYNKSTKVFSNVNRQYLPYGFDWYRNDWETLVNAELQIENLRVSDFTRTLASGHSISDPKPLYNVISPNYVKANYKIAHRIIDGVEKLIEYSIWVKISGTVSIASSDTFFDDPSASLLPIVGQPQIHQFEELNLTSGSRTGIIYKSDDSDLTNFNKIRNVLGSFGSLKTMKLISSLQEMKKEFSPVFTYSTASGQGSVKSVLNSAKGILKINAKEYLVPWYASFNSTENEVLLDIVLDNDHSATGKVKVITLIEDVDKITLAGDVETSVSESNKGTTLNKKIKIKFIKPVNNHTVIEVRFYDDAKASTAGYVGEIIGLLNLYKNEIQYKLNVQYVDVKFKGTIDNLTTEKELDHINNPGVKTKINIKINFNNNDVTYTNPNIQNATVGNGMAVQNQSQILNSRDLQTFVQSNIDLFRNTLNQPLIKPNIISNRKTLEINFRSFNVANPPTAINNGIDEIKSSIMPEYYDNIGSISAVALKVNLQNFIDGLISVYESINGTNERGIIMFFLPLTVLEYQGGDKFGFFKGAVERVNYSSKYLIMSRHLLEENAKEVPAHEVAHSLGLHHTFVDFTENSNKHHFVKSETLNVMDYPDLGPDPINNPLPVPLDFGVYLYKYQWDIMLGDVKTPTQRGDLIKINATDGTEIS